MLSWLPKYCEARQASDFPLDFLVFGAQIFEFMAGTSIISDFQEVVGLSYRNKVDRCDV
jgi:hypothetical protein